jgi:FHS family L-fucose permease-like MFS transporter
LRLLAPGRVLAFACIAAAVLVTVSGFGTGAVAGYTLLAVGLMNSIMFPTIFSLGVEGLGDKASEGSGLLCMGIVGGALIPLLVGLVADRASLGAALAIPALCYVFIAGYGWKYINPSKPG